MDFRLEAREWLTANCPDSLRRGLGGYTAGGRKATYGNPDTKLWLDRMAERGWTAPTWPKEYGGGGLTNAENMILDEEMRRINAPAALAGHGLTMIGPAIIEFGNDAQCREHLPPIARGEIRWCQGYSEPGAGSDLAGLMMRADEDGDDYIVNGSKIWTSGAVGADWIFCLVRTDFKASKHEGISFLVLDMETPGVTVTPIELISGASEFCQTFFDDVRVPKRNLIGQPGNGWTVGKRLLQYERSSIGGRGGTRQKAKTIDEWAKEYVGEADGRIVDPAIRDSVTEQRIGDDAYQLTIRRSFEEATSSQAPSFLSSMFKLYGTEQNMRRNDLLMSILGTQGLGWAGDGFTGAERGSTRGWLRSKANSIEGGTSEIQRNIIAKRVLGLPD
ncbi:MAG: acyl-CoA dehydrogenase [Gammaproteobacteria bacterium]|nr:acyl-CoA dehydrogenase [Gammaproteobacteria bacterium]MYF29067.1 acyl-CoA dehydrogenase [Gammaproteobacteria bacterium]MYK46960.1 acyl-CoA dehydrogenase [Gammaproteobacteria bacterium]